MVPIGRKTYFLLNEPSPAQMERDLLLCVSFCHSTFPSHTGDRWMGLIDVCATMAFPKAHDMRPVRINTLKSYCMMLCMLLCMKLCMT